MGRAQQQRCFGAATLDRAPKVQPRSHDIAVGDLRIAALRCVQGCRRRDGQQRLPAIDGGCRCWVRRDPQWLRSWRGRSRHSRLRLRHVVRLRRDSIGRSHLDCWLFHGRLGRNLRFLGDQRPLIAQARQRWRYWPGRCWYRIGLTSRQEMHARDQKRCCHQGRPSERQQPQSTTEPALNSADRSLRTSRRPVISSQPGPSGRRRRNRGSRVARCCRFSSLRSSSMLSVRSMLRPTVGRTGARWRHAFCGA